MSVKKRIAKVIDRIMGGPGAMPDSPLPATLNRKMRRIELAHRQAVISAQARRKHEKRGAPGRSSKGRKPHRVS